MYYLTTRNPQAPGKVKGAYPDITDIPIQGFQVIKVPAPIKIDDSEPIDLASGFSSKDIKVQKFQGILTSNPLFRGVEYDLEIDPQHPLTRGSVGGLYTWLEPHQGFLQTEMIHVPAPSKRFLIYVEAYTLQRDGDTGHVFYIPSNPNFLDLKVSNTGVEQNLETVPPGVPFELTDFGQEILIRLENTTDERIYVSDLSFLY